MENIAKAFLKAQTQFAPALKTNTNPHFKSKYVALDACIEAVIDALHANGIALIQKTHDSDTGVKVETIFVHETGEQISGGTLFVPADKNNPQGYGSALTYARRYSLMASCGIAPEDDDSNASSRPADKKLQQMPVFDLGKSLEQIGQCKTLEQLKTVYQAQYKLAHSEQEKYALTQRKDEIKSLIESMKEAA